MKRLLACLILLAPAAWAQTPPAAPPKPVDIKAQPTCPDCGVIRSVRRVETNVKQAPVDSTKPSGLVATIPLKGKGAQVGSSTDIGREHQSTAVTWEVVVRLDNGSFRLVMQPDAEGLREGDKVRIDEGKVVLR